MAVREYIGARYVPVFADPIAWSISRSYEPLTIVTHQGNSYTSRQYVPAGVPIGNETYWALTSNFNAQIEQYRGEVSTFDGRITTAQDRADEAYDSIESLEGELGSAAYKNYTSAVEESDSLPTSRAVKGTTDALRSEITSLSAIKENKPTRAIYIGNSYTAGFGSEGIGGLHALTSDLFDASTRYTTSGGAFVDYDQHDTNFVELLRDAINDESFSNDEVTHVIFISAVGDTNASAEFGTDYYNSLQNALNSIDALIDANFPNIRRCVTAFAEVRGTYTLTSGNYSFTNDFRQPYHVNHFMHLCASKTKHMEYLGWIGWPCTGRSTYVYTDNIHPSGSGYLRLANAFKSAWFGNFEYQPVSFNIPLAHGIYGSNTADATISFTPLQVWVHAGLTSISDMPATFTGVNAGNSKVIFDFNTQPLKILPVCSSIPGSTQKLIGQAEVEFNLNSGNYYRGNLLVTDSGYLQWNALKTIPGSKSEVGAGSNANVIINNAPVIEHWTAF